MIPIRVIIWGHKPITTVGLGRLKRTSHTHSHIHSGYNTAFKFLGFETHWLPNRPSISGEDLRGALVITEGQQDSYLPITPEAIYVTHHSESMKYDRLGHRRLRLQNYVNDLQTGDSYNFPGNPVQRLDKVTFLDEKAWALYQPWATDLLPNSSVTIPSPQGRLINYVGTTRHDGIFPKFKDFKIEAKLSGYLVRSFSGVSDRRAMELVRQSALGVDIRGDWHLQRGYIPCRLWKGLSYGRPMASNSPLLDSVFESRVAIAKNSSLFQTALQNEAVVSMEMRRENQEWVLKNHTFVNRAQRILEVLKNA